MTEPVDLDEATNDACPSGYPPVAISRQRDTMCCDDDSLRLTSSELRPVPFLLNHEHRHPRNGTSNSLPSPAGPFDMNLRMHEPRPEVIGRSCQLSPIRWIDPVEG